MAVELYYPPLPPFKNGISPDRQLVAYKRYDGYVIQTLMGKIVKEMDTGIFLRRNIRKLEEQGFDIHWVKGDSPL
jgi:hypothetical protein